MKMSKQEFQEKFAGAFESEHKKHFEWKASTYYEHSIGIGEEITEELLEAYIEWEKERIKETREKDRLYL
jgi:hypothetical protein